MKGTIYRHGRIFAVLLVCLGLTSTVHAQTGSIAGTVVDSETGETLIGANVIIEGTTIGSTTDLDGKYLIKAVEPGTHNLVFSYIGYESKTVQNAQVAPGVSTSPLFDPICGSVSRII